MPRVPAIADSQLPEGKPYSFSHDNTHVVVMRHDGKIHAMSDLCPHRGAFISSGPVDGPVLTCPWHEWSFNITTGECLTNPNALQIRYPVSVENGMVVVDLPAVEGECLT